jgi:hypothetical protein
MNDSTSTSSIMDMSLMGMSLDQLSKFLVTSTSSLDTATNQSRIYYDNDLYTNYYKTYTSTDIVNIYSGTNFDTYITYDLESDFGSIITKRTEETVIDILLDKYEYQYNQEIEEALLEDITELLFILLKEEDVKVSDMYDDYLILASIKSIKEGFYKEILKKEE